MSNVKRMYRIEQFVMTGVVNDIVLMAAMSNGGKKYIPLKYMADYVETERLKYPTLTGDISVNLIGENNLTIDKGTENLLAITEIEVLELIDEDAPSLFTYANQQVDTGIVD